MFIDDAADEAARLRVGREVLPSSELDALRDSGFTDVIIAIGDNRTRARRYAEAIARGLDAVSVIHPAAFVSKDTSIGEGTVVMPLAAINAGARIGADCTVNTGAIVEHDCVVGDHSHVAPGAALGGGVAVGTFAFIGMKASVLPLVEIGAGSIVGAGSVVLKSVPAGETVAGVPAALIRKHAAVREAGAQCS